MNELFLHALSGNNHTGRPPLWLMRQAGRYMHEYRSLRSRYDFLTLCQTPDLITEVTLLPIDAFGFDAAILFSDILLMTKPLGFHLRFVEGVGPELAPLLTAEQDLERLHGKEIIPYFSFLFEAIRQLKSRLTVPLIGFAGAPFTVASYLIEGKSSKSLQKTKKWLFERPESFTKLLDCLAHYTIEYLNAQIEAGVDAVQLFDSWAHVLPEAQFQAFSAAYMQKITRGLKKKCPVILFCRGASLWAKNLAALDISPAIGLDWQADIGKVRKELGPQVCLQGNLDPDILLTDPQTVERETKRILHAMKGDPAFIFNLGHGIHPETPRQNVEALIRCVHNG